MTSLNAWTVRMDSIPLLLPLLPATTTTLYRLLCYTRLKSAKLKHLEPLVCDASHVDSYDGPRHAVFGHARHSFRRSATSLYGLAQKDPTIFS
ncbi:hypothetical protein BD309DRAFT_949358 [Dichomitus squalens]|nr:hypothetical protein BD309DRAFT_949358 [Dichomitus squalens]